MAKNRGGREIPTLGKGSVMSIPKAALKLFYEPELMSKDHANHAPEFFYTGDLDVLHKIVDIAGAKHCSLYTGQQVCSRLNSSPYWKSDGKIKGWGNRMANTYTPSEKGKSYYEENLKKLEL